MTTYQQYGIVPCAYRLPDGIGRIEERDRDAWAIVNAGCCLNTEGEWEVEPMPSNRTDEFKARTRFPIAEAMQRAVSHFKLRLM